MKKLFSTALAAGATLATPFLAFAQCASQSGSGLTNPLRYCSIVEFVENALRIFVTLALPVLAFFIVLAGFNFILARGNPSKLGKAKMNFLYVIIGTSLVLGAWMLANLIGGTITQITNG